MKKCCKNKVVPDYREFIKIFVTMIIVTMVFILASSIAEDRVEESLTDIYREMFVVDSLIMDLKLTIDSIEVK